MEKTNKKTNKNNNKKIKMFTQGSHEMLKCFKVFVMLIKESEFRSSVMCFTCQFVNKNYFCYKNPFPPASFFPVTSTNDKISIRNFLTFSFNLFFTLM